MIDENKLKSCPKKVLICRIKALQQILANHNERVDNLERALYWAKKEYQMHTQLLIQDYEMQIAKLKKGGAKCK